MAGVTTCVPDSFRSQLLSGTHVFAASGGDTMKFGLMKAQASLTGTYAKSTANYSDITGNSDELGNTGGYTTGGKTLTVSDPSVTSNVAITDYADLSWTSATFTTRAGFVYNSSKSNKIVTLHDFGADQAVSSGTFTAIFPAADASNAILRLA